MLRRRGLTLPQRPLEGFDDDATSAISGVWQQGEQAHHQPATSDSSHPNQQYDDDQYLTAIMPPLPQTQAHPDPNTIQQQNHQKHTNNNPILLEASVFGMWGFVILGTLYYGVTEHQRRRQRLRRQRQDRLEQFSPETQADRVHELQRALQATTMMVHTDDLVYHSLENKQDKEGLGSMAEHGHYSDSRDVESNNFDNTIDVDTFCQSNNHDMEHRDENDHSGESSTDSSCSEHEEIQHLCHAEQLDLRSPLSKQHSSSDIDDDHQWTLELPSTETSIGLTTEVPATCVICLKRYEPKDRVTWSPNHPSKNSNNSQQKSISCCHAFHSHCIVEWLAKLPDCSCPICRNTFCQLPKAKTKKQKRASS